METDGTPLEAEILTWEQQRDAIKPRLNKTFPSESVEHKGCRGNSAKVGAHYWRID